MTDPRVSAAASSRPPRRDGPRDPGDAWATGAHGAFWGLFGAAGLLVHDPDRGILLQHRAAWSHQGDTWAVPGGALHQGEDALAGAFREAQEEAAVPTDSLTPLFTTVLDLGYWKYTTVCARAQVSFDPVISDPESLDLQWIPVEAVDDKPLHGRFAEAWPFIRNELSTRRVLIVDAANVVGSRPDGWWKERRVAAQRLIDRLGGLSRSGIRLSSAQRLARDEQASHPEPAGIEPLPAHGLSWPSIVVVTEGHARGAAVKEEGEPVSGAVEAIDVVDADRDGDQAIVDVVARVSEPGTKVTVITADRGLRGRVECLGADVEGPHWLYDRLPAAETTGD